MCDLSIPRRVMAGTGTPEPIPERATRSDTMAPSRPDRGDPLTFADLAVAARVVVALVLATSAVAKMRTLRRVPARSPELGGYVVVTVAVAATLPAVELAVAALVLFV